MHQNQITSQWYFLFKYIYYLIRLVDLLHFLFICSLEEEEKEKETRIYFARNISIITT